MRNKLLTLVSVFVFLVGGSHGQITFQKLFGGNGNISSYIFSVQVVPSGGYILAGLEYGTTLHGQGFLLRIDSIGDTLWVKAYGDTMASQGYYAEPTTDNGFLLGGATQTVTGITNGYLIRTDGFGNLLWSKNYQNSVTNAAHQTFDGGFILGCGADVFTAGYTDCNFVKTDSVGNVLWSKTMGGSSFDFIKCIQQTTDGGYIALGRTQSFGAGNYDFYLIKLDINGNLMWSKTYGGNDEDDGYSVRQTADGGYILSGYSKSFSPQISAYVIKTDQVGDTLWSKVIPGITTGLSSGDANSIIQTFDGGYVLTGGGATLVKLDYSGGLLWAKDFGGSEPENANFICQTPDSGFIISAIFHSSGSSYRPYVLKTNMTGSFPNHCLENSITPTIENCATQVTTAATVINPGTTIVTIPSIASTDWVSSDSLLCSSVGLPEFSKLDAGIILFPNPVENYITLHFPFLGNQKAFLVIFNSIGEAVLGKQILLEDQTLNLSALPQGIYLVSIRSGGQSWTKMIVK